MNPTEFIQIFLKNSTELIDFLEHIHQVSRLVGLAKCLRASRSILTSFKSQINDSKEISNTLLELYVNSISESKGKPDQQKISPSRPGDQGAAKETSPALKSGVSLKEKRALEFLANSSYDVNLALIVCQLHNFKVGPGHCYIHQI